MTNPELLICALDEGLDHSVDLVIFGRSAIALGFECAPSEAHDTLDIDAIIPVTALEALTNDDNFWDARDAVNVKFADQGLYITHLFSEEQVFLRKCWLDEIVKISRPQTRFLNLFRPQQLIWFLRK